METSKFHNQFEQQYIDLTYINLACRAAEPKWSENTKDQLTAFMLGLPVKLGYQFEVIGGQPVQTRNGVQNTLTSEIGRKFRKRLKQAKTARLRISQPAKSVVIASTN